MKNDIQRVKLLSNYMFDYTGNKQSLDLLLKNEKQYDIWPRALSNKLDRFIGNIIENDVIDLMHVTKVPKDWIVTSILQNPKNIGLDSQYVVGDRLHHQQLHF